MAEEKSKPRNKIGDRVRILRTGFNPGPIVELRGPLGPGGAQIYRVRVRGKPRPAYIEVREDQFELGPDESKPQATA